MLPFHNTFVSLNSDFGVPRIMPPPTLTKHHGTIVTVQTDLLCIGQKMRLDIDAEKPPINSGLVMIEPVHGRSIYHAFRPK